jgi:hypothetical protein
MKVERTLVEGTSDDPSSEPQQPSYSEAGRPPPIVLTSAKNLMKLQRQIRDFVKGNFEFRNTRSGTKIVIKEMDDFSAIKKHLESTNLSYFTYFPKSEKPIKAVIRHLPSNTPAQDICDGLTDLGFHIISVKQMSSTLRSSSKGTLPRNLPLFLITLPRTARSQEIFQLTALCHIAIGVEVYRAQNGLTKCHNSQQFGRVWANCKQPPRCLWCGGDHLHKGCPEKENAASTPACFNCQLVEGEKLHPANYQGCRHAKEELQKRKAQGAHKTAIGRMFSSNLNTPGFSFGAALRGGAAQQQQPQARQVPGETPLPAGVKLSTPASGHQQKTGQSVRAPNVNSQQPTVVTVVQQIMTRVQRCCVRRRQNSGYYQNCTKSHETKWPLEFIGPSKS